MGGLCTSKKKMKFIKSHLKEWHQDHSKNLSGKIEELKKAVNTLEFKGESTSLSDEEIRFKTETITELFNLSNLNCSILWQKSCLR
jgi:uncharacterized sporulation protein YeaH/YhbH (DUF444 family)